MGDRGQGSTGAWGSAGSQASRGRWPPVQGRRVGAAQLLAAANGLICAGVVGVKAPEDHQAYLTRKDFVLDCAAPNFTADDRKLLTRYGHWLTALANGVIRPFTAAQEHFLKVAHGEAEPNNDLERAWDKLVERRKFEAEARATPHFRVTDPGEDWLSRAQTSRTKHRPM